MNNSCSLDFGTSVAYPYQRRNTQQTIMLWQLPTTETGPTPSDGFANNQYGTNAHFVGSVRDSARSIGKSQGGRRRLVGTFPPAWARAAGASPRLWNRTPPPRRRGRPAGAPRFAAWCGTGPAAGGTWIGISGVNQNLNCLMNEQSTSEETCKNHALVPRKLSHARTRQLARPGMSRSTSSVVADR